MKKLKQIETKIKEGLPLTKQERAYHLLFAKTINLEVLSEEISL